MAGGGVGRECRGPLPNSPRASPRETPWGMAAAMRLVPEPAGREEEAQGGAWSSSQASELVFKILFGGLVSSTAGLAFVPVCWSRLLPWGSSVGQSSPPPGPPQPSALDPVPGGGVGTALVTEQDLRGLGPSVY